MTYAEVRAKTAYLHTFPSRRETVDFIDLANDPVTPAEWIGLATAWNLATHGLDPTPTHYPPTKNHALRPTLRYAIAQVPLQAPTYAM